jgi:hypothetical protein
MKLKALAIAALAALGAGLLASCETMSAEQCQAADWGQLGFSDASSNGADRFDTRSHSCAEKGFTADADAYRNGFGRGIRDFCVPERGFSLARNGGSFSGQCPADLAGGFNDGYSDGRRVHEAQANIDQANYRVNDAESQRRQIDSDIRDRERALAAATTDDERNRWRGEINQLRGRRHDVNDDLSVAQNSLPRLMRIMDDIRAELGGKYGSW